MPERRQALETLQKALTQGRPKILERLAERSLQYYDAPERTLPTLNGVNDSPRRQRSERREACLSVLALLIAYTDLKTLRIGIPTSKGSMAGLSLTWMALRLGLGQRRVERALRDLVCSGLVDSRQRSHRKRNGHYQGAASFRALSPHLFTLLGLGKWQVHEQKRAQKRQSKRDIASLARENALRLLAIKASKRGPYSESTLAARYFALIRASLECKSHTSGA